MIKKFLGGAILFIGLNTVAFAQQTTDGKAHHYSPEKRAERMSAVMADKLSLTDEQKAKVYAINLESIQKRDMDRKERMAAERDAMKALLQKQDEEINSILNAEQKVTYEKLKKEHFSAKRNPRSSHDKEKIQKD